MQIFESCRYTGPAASFKSLMDKSLVKLDGDGRIVMHDLLRDMGREVVKDQSLMDKAPPSRLWDPEIAERVLAHREVGTSVVPLPVLAPLLKLISTSLLWFWHENEFSSIYCFVVLWLLQGTNRV
jgi:hypothetical protein